MSEGKSHHSDDLQNVFRIRCPRGHDRFAILDGRDKRLAEERGEVVARCWGCSRSVRFEVVAP